MGALWCLEAPGVLRRRRLGRGTLVYPSEIMGKAPVSRASQIQYYTKCRDSPTPNVYKGFDVTRDSRVHVVITLKQNTDKKTYQVSFEWNGKPQIRYNKCSLAYHSLGGTSKKCGMLTLGTPSPRAMYS